MLNLVFAIGLLACTPTRPFGIRFFTIATNSMEPNLHRGTTVAASRCAYGLSRWSYDWFELPLSHRWPAGMPRRGDIVMFRLPAAPSNFWVKRVIGLPGDRIELRKGRLYVNGVAVQRESVPAVAVRDFFDRPIEAQAFRETLPDGTSHVIIQLGAEGAAGRSVPPVAVPVGQIYLLGDNRDDSVDSRMGAAANWGGFGTVPVEYIFGPVVGVGYWPPDLLQQWSRRG